MEARLRPWLDSRELERIDELLQMYGTVEPAPPTNRWEALPEVCC